MNDMDPLVPIDHLKKDEFLAEFYQLSNERKLTTIEEALIAKNQVLMQAFRLKGGSYGFKGGVICFPQRISDLTRILPRKVNELKIVIVRSKTGDSPADFKEFKVRRDYVRDWLLFLIKWSPIYSDVSINENNMDELPMDLSVYHDLPTFQQGSNVLPVVPTATADDDEVVSDEDDDDNDDDDGFGAEHGPHGLEFFNDDIQITGVAEEEYDTTTTEIENILNALAVLEPMSEQKEQDSPQQEEQGDSPQHDLDDDVIPWPERGLLPVDERSFSHLLASGFPCLFPCGCGDVTSSVNRKKQVSFNDAAKHYIKYAYHDPISRTIKYPFAENPQFLHFIQNKDERARAMMQCSVFLSKNPEDAAISLNELRQDILGADDRGLHILSKKMQRFGANITGSPAYMSGKKSELMALMEQEGAGHVWFTFSMPTWMWADLRKLWGDPPLQKAEESNEDFEKRSNSYFREMHNKNPHIVNEFFMKRANLFTSHFFGEDFLQTLWLWYRFEWQKRGGPHLHGIARLKAAEHLDFTKLSVKVVDGRRSVIILLWLKGRLDFTETYADQLNNAVLPLESMHDKLQMQDIFEGLKDTIFTNESVQSLITTVNIGLACERQIVKFRDYVISSNNPNSPLPNDASERKRSSAENDDIVLNPSLHPCIDGQNEFLRNGHFSLSSTWSIEKYKQLVMFCQRHRHNVSYCLNSNPNGECRFNFPRPIAEITTINVIDVLYKR